MLEQNVCAFCELSGSQEFVEFAVDRNEDSGMIVPLVDQNHSHSQFCDGLLIEGFQPLVSEKPDQQAVKVEIVRDGADPVASLDGGFVLLQSIQDVAEKFRIRGLRSKDCRDLEHSADVIDLLYVAE